MTENNATVNHPHAIVSIEDHDGIRVFKLDCGHEHAINVNNITDLWEQTPAIGDAMECYSCGLAARGIDPALLPDEGAEDDDPEEGP